jgi:hypothetical protein
VGGRAGLSRFRWAPTFVCYLFSPMRSVYPMRLLRIREPFDHLDFIFEPKLDGFRALAIVRGASASSCPATAAALVAPLHWRHPGQQRLSASSSRCQRSASRRLRFNPMTSARPAPPTIHAIIAKNTGVCGANRALE